MKRWLILLMCVIAGTYVCASEYASVVVPSGYIKKNDNIILYNKNLEEIFAHDMIKIVAGVKGFNAPTLYSLKKTLTTNPQLNSVIEPNEKIKIVSKIYGANKVININVRYEVKSVNNRCLSPLDKLDLISDNNAIRLITKVEILDISADKVVWSNTYYKNFNFDNVNSKDISLITNYYQRLSDIVFGEMKNRSYIYPVNEKSIQSSNNSNIEMKNETVENHVITPVSSSSLTPVNNSKIKPQLQLRENIGEKQKAEKSAKYLKKSVSSEDKPKPVKKPKVKTIEPKTVKTEPKVQTQIAPKNIEKQKPIEKVDKIKVDKDIRSDEKVKEIRENRPKNTDKELKIWQTIKDNLQFNLKSPTPEKEIKIEDIKSTPVDIMPSYTNIHVKPRKNSKDYVPQFNNSVNDI